jgi:hypothetical protein
MRLTMQRRSFLNSLIKTVSAVPLLVPALWFRSNNIETKKTTLFSDNGLTIPNGLGTGIMKIDKITNGIKGGELAIVYSPLVEISIALLVNIALYGFTKPIEKDRLCGFTSQ